jgi:xanthine dehydrogenase accessory factor
VNDIVAAIRQWQSDSKAVAIARVVSTWGSSPRRPGATLAVSSDGELVGSVSGGCIEGAVRDEALAVLSGGHARFVDYGVDDETAWSLGLSCGGTVRVLVQKLPAFGDELMTGVEAGERMVVATALDDGREYNILIRNSGEAVGDWPSDAASIEAAIAGVLRGNASTGEHEIEGVSCFLHVVPAPSKLIIIGGSDIAVHLVGFAEPLAFETILIDPRAVFSDRARFPVLPGRIETAWPQEVLPEIEIDSDTYAVLLTHDPKIDDPAIHLLLQSDVAYIGALGSGKTQSKRRERLCAAGFEESDLDRIHGPVGIDIGGVTPAEIALSIVAEIVSVRRRSFRRSVGLAS